MKREAEAASDAQPSPKRAETEAARPALGDEERAPAAPELMPLERAHPHPNDGRIVFVDDGHEYWIDGSRRGIKSVTKLAHFGFSEFDADAVIAAMQKDPAKWQRNKYYPMSAEEIKELWAKNANDAATRGTYIHRQIELYYNGLEHDADSREFTFFLNFDRAHPHLKIYRTEWNLFAPDLLIAGQADAVFTNEQGDMIIADWKRSKDIKRTGFCRCPGAWRGEPHRVGADGQPCEAFGQHPIVWKMPDCNYSQYTLQLNIYRWLLKHYYGIVANELFLVIVHPDQSDYIRIDLPIIEETVDAIMQVRREEVAEYKALHAQLMKHCGNNASVVNKILEYRDKH